MNVPEKTTFLLVDDFVCIRKLLRENLRALGMKGEIYDAENITDAFKTLEDNFGGSKEIGFIFSDWQMPGGTGLEFLEKVRNDDRFKGLPFIMVTTMNEQDLVLQAVTAGVSNYLVKPWNMKSLTEKMEAVWKKHGS